MFRLAVGLLLASVSAAHAVEFKTFYERKINDTWTMLGVIPESGNSKCIAQAVWDNGSAFEFRKDLVNGDVWFWIRNVNWEMVAGVDDKIVLHVNIMQGKRLLLGGKLPWELFGKNTVLIGDMNTSVVSKALWSADMIKIIMPGTTQNATVIFPGRQIVSATKDCMDFYAKAPMPNIDGVIKQDPVGKGKI